MHLIGLINNMSDLFRVGDLLITHKSYHPTQYYYCKIINITDSSGTSYSDYDIITGNGDLNSKVKIDLLAIGIGTDNETEIEELDEKIIITGLDPHNVHLRNPYKQIKKCKSEIDKHNKNINFFERNKNIIELRNEKIDKILGESYP
jgi:hypothetical protein